MPYQRNDDLPASVRNVLPADAQSVFRRVANAVLEEGGKEMSAFRQAWAAVGRGWEKSDDGKWVKKNYSSALSFVEALRELEKGELRTLYVRRNVKNADEIVKWAKSQGLSTTLPADDMHVTIAFSKQKVDWSDMGDHFDEIRVPALNKFEHGGFRKVERLGENGEVVVLRFDHQELQKRWKQLCDKGCSWDYDGYKPHITLSYNADGVDVEKMTPFQGEIVLGPEIFEDVDSDWRDGITEKRGARHTRKEYELLNKMHDMSVELGAECPGHNLGMVKSGIYSGQILKAEETTADPKLGLVFGWAMVTAEKNERGVFEPYFDLQGDNITDKAMLKSSMDFMLGSRTHKAMHDGEKVGTVVFMFPLAKDIANAFGLETKKTGLMIAVKPDTQDLLAKYESGEYKGFSIGGKRVLDEEID